MVYPVTRSSPAWGESSLSCPQHITTGHNLSAWAATESQHDTPTRPLSLDERAALPDQVFGGEAEFHAADAGEWPADVDVHVSGPRDCCAGVGLGLAGLLGHVGMVAAGPGRPGKG